MSTYPVIEQRGARPVRWLRVNRFKVALLIGAAETLTILFTDATWRWALVLAAVVFAFYIWIGRKSKRESVRQVSWVAAASQVLPVLIPIIGFFIATIAVIAVVAFAVVVGIMLFLDRRK